MTSTVPPPRAGDDRDDENLGLHEAARIKQEPAAGLESASESTGASASWVKRIEAAEARPRSRPAKRVLRWVFGGWGAFEGSRFTPSDWEEAGSYQTCAVPEVARKLGVDFDFERHVATYGGSEWANDRRLHNAAHLFQEAIRVHDDPARARRAMLAIEQALQSFNQKEQSMGQESE